MYRLGLVYTCCMGPRTKLPLAHLRQNTWQGRQMLIQTCALHVREVPVPNSADLQWVSQPSGGQWCSTIFKVPDTFFAACSAFFFLSNFFCCCYSVNFLAHVLPCANGLKWSLSNIWRQKKRDEKKCKRGNNLPFADRSRKCKGESKMYLLSKYFLYAHENCQLTETTVVYPLTSPRSVNSGASCLHSFARAWGCCLWKQQQFLLQPQPPPCSPSLQTRCLILCHFLGSPCYLLLFTTAPSLGLMLGTNMIKKSSFGVQIQNWMERSSIP